MEKEGVGRAGEICAHSNGMRRNLQSPIQHTTDCDPSNTSKNRVSSFSPFIGNVVTLPARILLVVVLEEGLLDYAFGPKNA